MVEANYALGEKFYSYEVLHDKLMNLMVSVVIDRRWRLWRIIRFSG